MQKLLVTIFLLIFSLQLKAQEDSLFVFPRNNRLFILHKARNGETIFALARRYHVPPALLADANGLTYQSSIANNTWVLVPLAAYNQLKEKPVNMNEARPLYYRVRTGDNANKISEYTGVSKHQLGEWNAAGGHTIRVGLTLLVGWVLFDPTGMILNKPIAGTSSNKPLTTTTVSNQTYTKKIVQNKDGSVSTILVPVATIPPPKPLDSFYLASPFGKLYVQQTDTNTAIDSDKGPAVFFETKASNVKNTFYAFSNTLERGTVVKVYNANSQKAILVKVIGTIPDSKQYYNSTIAITTAAKEALGITEDKVWCELWFGKGYRKPPPPESATPVK